jgi:hypothetical protein
VTDPALRKWVRPRRHLELGSDFLPGAVQTEVQTKQSYSEKLGELQGLMLHGRRVLSTWREDSETSPLPSSSKNPATPLSSGIKQQVNSEQRGTRQNTCLLLLAIKTRKV